MCPVSTDSLSHSYTKCGLVCSRQWITFVMGASISPKNNCLPGDLFKSNWLQCCHCTDHSSFTSFWIQLANSKFNLKHSRVIQQWMDLWMKMETLNLMFSLSFIFNNERIIYWFSLQKRKLIMHDHVIWTWVHLFITAMALPIPGKIKLLSPC